MTGDISEEHKTQPQKYRENFNKYKGGKSSQHNKQAYSEHIRKPASKNQLPIPKGDSAYALAKNAEYKERNLDKAEYYYKLAIDEGERVESAVKDLASLLHQRGRTKSACDLLKSYKDLFKKDCEKFGNLFSTLQKQIVSSSNSQNKKLKLSGLSPKDDKSVVAGLFLNPVRIQDTEFSSEVLDGKLNYFCILKFNSHSSARKTLEGFHSWEKFRVEWMTVHGELAGDAHYARQKMEEYRKHHPTFSYSLFERDPQGYVYCLPLDTSDLQLKRQASENEKKPEELLGANLFQEILV